MTDEVMTAAATDSTVGSLPNVSNAPDDALLVVEYLGKAYNSTLGQLKATLKAITSFTKTAGAGTPGSTDVYTLTFGDGTSATMSIRIPKDGTNGTDGVDGVSPTLAVSDITGGHRVTITDKNGTKTVDVMDGVNGKDGADGVSPRLNVTEVGGGHRITIIDKDGTEAVDVLDGVSPKVTIVEDPNGCYVKFTDADDEKSYYLKNGEQGDPGPEGNHPYQVTITESEESNGVNEIAFYMTNGDVHKFQVRNGKNATMPVINVTEIDGGHRLTFTDVYGTKSMDIMDGEDGGTPDVDVTDITGGHCIKITEPSGHIHTINVMDGAAGVSPTIEVSEIDGGHRLTIRDNNGTKFVDVLDGDNASAGVKSWNELEGKPFYKSGTVLGTAVASAGDTLTWDGDIANTPGYGADESYEGVVEFAYRLCRVSSVAPIMDDIGYNGGTLFLRKTDSDGSVSDVTVDLWGSSATMETIDGDGNVKLLWESGETEDVYALLIQTPITYTFFNQEYVLNPGVYFTYIYSASYTSYCVTGLTVNNYTGFVQEVKPLDPVFLPPLVSPNGKKFKLVVDDNGNLTTMEVTT